ncbi:c-type cytochrome [Leptothrix discophora]|uniref:Cytochrome C n=1 Tax=Leptothrix discophora TaxID=89 RepID=A0ABT9G7T0_LEPDI|nr:cytochrome C [Leptothrix discophora]MDP4302539.1 cytochrome C [Leptothrix discophora]
MPRSPNPTPAGVLAGLLLALSTLTAVAQPTGRPAPEALRLRALAATCAHCHGTDGRAVEGEATIRLAGLPADYLLTQLMAFRSGQRPATIMHQITKGYSQEQLESLATYFGGLK